MQNFESIRPYRDDEVAGVIRRLSHDPALLRAAAAFFAPRLSRLAPWVAQRLAGHTIRRRTAKLDSVHAVQLWLAGYMARVIRDTIHELTVEGMEHVPHGRPHLFLSNHRDIVMDSALLNYLLHQAGHRTARAAVGNNLLSEPFAADLMRLNKSFVVERDVAGTKAMYQAMNRTSSYIRHSLEEGESVWIAQRGGRTKDGFDRTDPALLKMLSLAHRKELRRFDELLDRVSLVPVAVSYELDPCDRRKAHELYRIARDGHYRKEPGEDLASMVDGIVGYKARVHFRLAPPLEGDFPDPDAMAAALDRIIVGGMRVYPTHVEAARRLGIPCADSAEPPLPRAMRAFEARIEACPEPERPYLLGGYGNLLRNRQALGLDEPEAAAV
ncbi:MAG TPA: 1-acyl-sn-glycerol-3-phosphate acyltransferase [Pseudomonadales bacterium]